MSDNMVLYDCENSTELIKQANMYKYKDSDSMCLEIPVLKKNNPNIFWQISSED